MRKVMMLFLLASVASPALARPNDPDPDRSPRSVRSEIRAERAERRESRPERAERTQRTERAETQRERADAVPAERPRWNDGERRGRIDRVPSTVEAGIRAEPRAARDPRSGFGREAYRGEARTDRGDSVRDWRPRNIESADRTLRDTRRQPSETRDRRAGDRQDNSLWGDRVRERLVTSVVARPGTQPPPRAGRDGHRRDRDWDRRWRDDRRYDWRGHRNRNRSAFHVGFYYDPFGWNYQRYQPGWRMWPNYYGRNYWLGDTSMYRLPPAYPGTQWIRYHGDAILVDTWTGEVVDVIYDFFW